jgi:hypothetical protein
LDRVYKADIPAARRALEELKRRFLGLKTETDWARLRIEPLLQHVKVLEGLLRSRRFTKETSRLPRGVAMFHSDLVYLRENIIALRTVLRTEMTKHPKNAQSPVAREKRAERRRA